MISMHVNIINAWLSYVKSPSVCPSHSGNLYINGCRYHQIFHCLVVLLF